MGGGNEMAEISELLDFSFAEDVVSEWDMYMEESYSIAEATTQILDQYLGMLDENETEALYVALALIQIPLEEVDGRIKREINEMLGTKSLETCFNKEMNIKPYLQQLKKHCR